MPQRQPKAAIARREEKLLRYYAKVWQDVVDLQAAIVADPKQFRKARKLREAQRAIEAQLDTIDTVAAQWFSKTFPEVWGMGVSASARELKADPGRVFSAINTDAVQRLADDGFGDLLKATRNVRLTQKRMIRSVIEDVTLNKLIAGDTAAAAGRRAAKLIEKAGVSAITYADGSRHGLREYANMAVRTKTAVAYNLGTLEAATSQGVKFWEVFDGICGLTYHDGPTANGMIVDYDTALAYPISHPNCRRAFGARPDLDPSSLPPQTKLAEPPKPANPFDGMTDAEVKDAIQRGGRNGEARSAQTELVRRRDAEMKRYQAAQAVERAKYAGDGKSWVQVPDQPFPTYQRGEHRVLLQADIGDELEGFLSDSAKVLDSMQGTLVRPVTIRVPSADKLFVRRINGVTGGYVTEGIDFVNINPLVARNILDGELDAAAKAAQFMPGSATETNRLWTIAHEFGHMHDHHHDHTHDGRASGGFFRKAKKDLSRYGASSRQEGYAEAWAQWLLKGPGSSEVADRYAKEYGWPEP